MMNKQIILKAAAAATAIALTLCGCSAAPGSTARYASPAVTLQPADIQTRAGEDVTFRTAAEGDGLSYQWYYKKPSSHWSVWKGHDTAVTSAPANSSWNGMRVYCCITDSSGRSVATRSALITIGKPVEIIMSPGDVTVNLGETAYFHVEAAGKGKLKYQWYYRKSNSVLWTRWRGHTDSSTEAVANNSWNGMQVCCLVADSAGSSALSDYSTVTVIDSPTVISQPKDACLSADGKAEFTVAGGTEGLVYQWFCTPAGAFTGVKLIGRNDPTLTVATESLWSGARIYCRLKSPGGSMTFSDSAGLVGDGIPIVTSQPQPVACLSGDTMQFSVRASGKGLRYRWYFRYKDTPGWCRLAGHDGREIAIPAAPALSGGEIRCEVTGAGGGKALSAPARVAVSDRADITRQPRDVTVSSDEIVRMRVSAGSGDALFQWYAKTPGSFFWNRVAGQTGGEFVGIAQPSWHGMQLKCRVTVPGGGWVDSRAATVTVNDIFTLTESPESITERSGNMAAFAVKASGRDLQYQWLRRSEGSDIWSRWDGQTGSSVRMPAETSWHRMHVRCVVSDCTGKQLYSKVASVWITDALDILRHPRGISVKAYEPAEFSVKAQGKGLRYQWYYKKRGMSNWHIWRKHTTAYTTAVSNPTWDGMRVKCVVCDSEGNKISSRQAAVRISG